VFGFEEKDERVIIVA
jgi:hypothetical protein